MCITRAHIVDSSKFRRSTFSFAFFFSGRLCEQTPQRCGVCSRRARSRGGSACVRIVDALPGPRGGCQQSTAHPHISGVIRRCFIVMGSSFLRWSEAPACRLPWPREGRTAYNAKLGAGTCSPKSGAGTCSPTRPWRDCIGHAAGTRLFANKAVERLYSCLARKLLRTSGFWHLESA